MNVLHQAGTVTLDGAGYTYDNTGNRIAKTNYLNNITEQYTYDPLYQLTQVTQGATTTESYSYDAVGNRLSSLAMSPYAYNSSNELTSTPSATFTYDSNGNILTKADSNGTTTYNWDFENRLTSVALPGTGGTVTFRYDPVGRRIQKSPANGTTNYLYDGPNSIAEVDAAGSLLARYTQGGGIDEPLAELRGTVAYYDQEGLGSVTSLSNPDATLANTYLYDAFGNSTSSTGALANPFQYTGRDYDAETGLRYYRARYYDPIVGRFISEDPMAFNGSGTNFYPYVGGDPIDYIDPSGLVCEGAKPKPKRCAIRVAIPAPVQIRDETVEKIYSAAGIDINFVSAGQTTDYNVQYKDLSSLQAFGYAGAGPNLVQLDGPAIYNQGRASNSSSYQIDQASGYILAHELGHKLLDAGHSPTGIMRPGLDTGAYAFLGLDFGGNFYFTPEQAAIIKRKCRHLHPLRH